jgi:hypothetical protein
VIVVKADPQIPLSILVECRDPFGGVTAWWYPGESVEGALCPVEPEQSTAALQETPCANPESSTAVFEYGGDAVVTGSVRVARRGNKASPRPAFALVPVKSSSGPDPQGPGAILVDRVDPGTQDRGRLGPTCLIPDEGLALGIITIQSFAGPYPEDSSPVHKERTDIVVTQGRTVVGMPERSEGVPIEPIQSIVRT